MGGGLIYMKKIDKKKLVLIMEIIYIVILTIKCLGTCTEFTIDRNSLNKSFEGDLVYFDDGSVGIESQSSEEFELLNTSLSLGSGAYNIKVVYDSVSNYDVPNIDNCAGRVGFSTENSAVLKAGEIWLHDGNHEEQTRIWLRQGSGTNLVKIYVKYHGNGKLAIKSISVEEKREYRVIICIAVFILFAVCDFLYLLFRNRDNEKTKFVVTGIMGITVFSSMTYFSDFLYWGHDLSFHLLRISSLAEGLKEFQIPHRIQFNMLNGYGYATPLYYGEIFLLLPAILYDFYVPLQTCYQVFIVLLNLATCTVSYWCFSRMSQDWRKGLLGSAVYTLAAYRMVNVMVRAAVGEIMAFIFFPLLIYGLYNIYTKKEDDKIVLKDYLPIILSATGIINSHILSCEIVVIFTVFFMVFRWRKTFRKNIFQALLKSSVFTFLLNMWFIVPFIQSMGMEVDVTNKDYIYMIERNNVYLPQLFGIFHSAGGLNVEWGTHNEMSLSLGLPILLGIAMFLYVCIKKEAWGLSCHKIFEASKICFILGLTALFFTSNLCKWDNIKVYSETLARIVGMVQFPWRYLGIATVCFVTMIIFLLQIIEETSIKRCREAMAFLVAAVVITEGYFMMEYVKNQNEVRIHSESNIGTMEIMGAEYLLQGTNREKYKNKIIFGEEGTQVTEFYHDKNGKYYLVCTNRNDYSSYIDVPVQAYENYHAYSSNGKELAVGKGENNRIRIYIPEKFEDIICLKYRIPILWRICEAISLITACIIILLLRKTITKYFQMCSEKYLKLYL